MSNDKPTLLYFTIPGRAYMIRCILNAGKIDFNDNTVMYPPSADPNKEF